MQRTAKFYIETGFPKDARLIILHPNFDSQHLLIPEIAERSGKLLILNVQTANTGLEELWQLLAAALATGYQVDLPPLASLRSVEAAAERALTALLAIGSVSLLFDAFDLAPDAAVASWVAQVAAGLKDGSRVIIGTRRLPVRVLTEALAQEALAAQIAIFPIDEDRMLLDYLAIPNDRIVLEVYAHGSGKALVNGQLIERWDGVLPRNLFFFLVDRGMTTRDEIFQTFWPNLSIREATNVFHVTKRKISELLGFDLTVYWSGYYRLSSTIDLRYDVVQFGEFAQNSAVAEGDAAIDLLEKAVHLYRGTFLGSLDAPWITSRRNDLRTTYMEVLSTLGKIYESRENYLQALNLYQRALVIQPHREDLVRNMMLILQELEQPERAVDMFSQLTESLKRGYGVAPDKKNVELAEQLRKQAKGKR